MIGTKFYKPLLDDSAVDDQGAPATNTYRKYAEAAEWCNSNNATIEDLGEYYEVVAIPEPSDEEKLQALKLQYNRVVQNYLDQAAQCLDYDDCASVCGYVGCGVEKYETEAIAFVKWRAEVWNTYYPIWNEIVQTGVNCVLSDEDIIAKLPGLTICYADGSELKIV